MDGFGHTNKAHIDNLWKKTKGKQYEPEEGSFLSVYITNKAVCFSDV